MRTTFFVPRGEQCPIKPGHVIAGRLVIDQFIGNVTTPSHIGYTFSVRAVTFRERLLAWQDGSAEPVAGLTALRSPWMSPSQWEEVRQAG